MTFNFCTFVVYHQVALASRQQRNLSVFELSCHVLSTCLPHTVESSCCPFLLLNAKQGIEPRSSISVRDARPLIGANIFFLQQKLRYLTEMGTESDPERSRSPATLSGSRTSIFFLNVFFPILGIF